MPKPFSGGPGGKGGGPAAGGQLGAPVARAPAAGGGAGGKGGGARPAAPPQPAPARRAPPPPSAEDELEQRFGLRSGGFEGLAGGGDAGLAEREERALRGMMRSGKGRAAAEEDEDDEDDDDDDDDMEGAALDSEVAAAAAKGKAKGKPAAPPPAPPAKAPKQPPKPAAPAPAPASKKGGALVAPPAPASLKAQPVLLGKKAAGAPPAAAAAAAAPPAKRGLLDDDDDDEEDEEEGDDDDDGEEEEEEDEEDEDEDDESVGSIGGADVYRGGDLEVAAAKASAKRARIEAEAEADMRLAIAEQETYQLPTARELEAERAAPPRLGHLKRRFTDVAHVLTNFRARREPGRAREEYVACMAQDLADFYGYNRELVDILLPLFSPAEALQFFAANEEPPPVTIRVNTLKAKRRDLVQALMARGANLEPVGPWSKAGFKVLESPVPIGATPEYLAGHYMLQSAASLVPVMALAPVGGERVLDIAAAPGGKTTHLAQLMGNTGVLVANDLKKERLPSLVANLARMGVSNAIVCCMDGRALPQKLGRASQDRVLLDAPCSGLGVIARDPAARTNKGMEDVLKMAQLQVSAGRGGSVCVCCVCVCACAVRRGRVYEEFVNSSPSIF
jgi:NOL1/NOP2/sun family putative RNA methylase